MSENAAPNALGTGEAASASVKVDVQDAVVRRSTLLELTAEKEYALSKQRPDGRLGRVRGRALHAGAGLVH